MKLKFLFFCLMSILTLSLTNAQSIGIKKKKVDTKNLLLRRKEATLLPQIGSFGPD